jgi:hypothetical protein
MVGGEERRGARARETGRLDGSGHLDMMAQDVRLSPDDTMRRLDLDSALRMASDTQDQDGGSAHRPLGLSVFTRTLRAFQTRIPERRR